jgi:hypothetical protein
LFDLQATDGKNGGHEHETKGEGTAVASELVTAAEEEAVTEEAAVEVITEETPMEVVLLEEVDVAVVVAEGLAAGEGENAPVKFAEPASSAPAPCTVDESKASTQGEASTELDVEIKSVVADADVDKDVAVAEEPISSWRRPEQEKVRSAFALRFACSQAPLRLFFPVWTRVPILTFGAGFLCSYVRIGPPVGACVVAKKGTCVYGNIHFRF